MVISIIITGMSANIFIIPILAYTYNEISFVFIISTIIITPILCVTFFSGYINLLISFIFPKISTITMWLSKIMFGIFNYIANISSKINFLRIQITTPNFIVIAFYYLIVLYFTFLYKKSHKPKIKKCFIIVIVISLVFTIVKNYNRNFEIHFIDVGQGDSTLSITKQNTKILIDGGGSEIGDYDVGEKVLVPYLLDRGIKNIDYIIISHFDEDHCGGLVAVIEKLKVKNVIIAKQFKYSSNYEKFIELTQNKKIKLIDVEAGSRINIDTDVYIDVIWPNSNKIINENILNNNSLVCKIKYKNFSMLCTGDVEELAEVQILEQYKGKQILKSDILKVAHHGSKSSSIDGVLAEIKPQIALIGVGKNNKFGHPNNGVLERLQTLKCKIYRTDECGEISIIVNNQGKIKNIKTHIK